MVDRGRGTSVMRPSPQHTKTSDAGEPRTVFVPHQQTPGDDLVLVHQEEDANRRPVAGETNAVDAAHVPDDIKGSTDARRTPMLGREVRGRDLQEDLVVVDEARGGFLVALQGEDPVIEVDGPRRMASSRNDECWKITIMAP